MANGRDPRWIILLESGEYSIVGRHREPDPDDISRLEDALERTGQAGWLAVMDRSEHAVGTPEIVLVRPLRAPTTSFDDALAAFHRRRDGAAPALG